MKEKNIRTSIQRFLKERKIFHWVSWQGPMSRSGVSDILGCFNGRLLAIEVKQPGKKPTALQQRFIDMVNMAGGIAFVATSVEDAKEALNDL